jgi:hypothetical protein
MEVWVILLFLWIAWKVFGSIFEEMQARKRRQQTLDTEETISQPPSRRVPPVARPAERTMASTPSASTPPPMDKEERDIERLLREAMARKHQPMESPEKARPQPTKVTYVERQTVETISPMRQKTLPPIEEHRFKPPPPMEPYHHRLQSPPVEHRKVVQKRVIRRVEPVPARQAPRLPEAAAKLVAPPRVRRRGRGARSFPLFLTDGLNKCEVRKGIVMAEILGEPKAFRM